MSRSHRRMPCHASPVGCTIVGARFHPLAWTVMTSWLAAVWRLRRSLPERGVVRECRLEACGAASIGWAPSTRYGKARQGRGPCRSARDAEVAGDGWPRKWRGVAPRDGVAGWGRDDVRLARRSLAPRRAARPGERPRGTACGATSRAPDSRDVRHPRSLRSELHHGRGRPRLGESNRSAQ